MPCRARRVTLLRAAVLSVAGYGCSPPQQPLAAGVDDKVVGPGVVQWLGSASYRAHQGAALADGKFDRPGGWVPISIRVRAPEGVDRLLELEGADLELRRIDGQVLQARDVVFAEVSERGLAAVASQPFARRVELDWTPAWAAPLALTTELIEAPPVWTTRDDHDLPVTGTGVVVADIDTGVDVFHPMFFRADGGRFDWIDVDDDGVFEPDQDAVDLDRDGHADADETLRFVDGQSYTLWSPEPILDSDNRVFDPGVDHLYADSNRNGSREFGRAAGFSEADPSYGEPLLLVDDADRNGALDAGETLVALGTSKIRAVFDGQREWTRGVDLIDAPGHFEPWGRHGTQMSGIVLGGQRGYSRYVGVAPDAELLMGAFGHGGGNSDAAFAWAIERGADVVLHEYVSWTGTHLDGSTNKEAMIDAASAAGVPQITCAGNMGVGDKHARLDLVAGTQQAVALSVPTADYVGVAITVHWRRPERVLRFALRGPSGATTQLGSQGGSFPVEGGAATVIASRDVSARGTVMFHMSLGGPGGLPAGQWVVTAADIDGPADGSQTPLSLYVSDDHSGWNKGVRFTTSVSLDHLVGAPATADSAITVGSYTGHGEPPINVFSESAGELRAYSNRGDRIDGLPILDVAAPDNPVTAVNAMKLQGVRLPFGAYMVGGGTSAAGPHVAGAVALLKQLRPEVDGAAARDAIRDGALVDADVHGDATHSASQLWGAGKLRVYQALYGDDPP